MLGSHCAVPASWQLREKGRKEMFEKDMLRSVGSLQQCAASGNDAITVNLPGVFAEKFNITLRNVSSLRQDPLRTDLANWL